MADHQEAATQLVENVTATMEADETATALATTIVPKPGVKLVYYKTLIEWIISVATQLERDVVLKGFLHGEDYLSYFKIEKFLGQQPNVDMVGDDYLDFDDSSATLYGVSIYIEKTTSVEERDKKFLSLNRKIKMSEFRKLGYDDYKSYIRVGRIFEDWVGYANLMDPYDFFQLSPEQQAEVEITSYTPITAMVNSLHEIVNVGAEDLKKLEEALKQISSRQFQ